MEFVIEIGTDEEKELIGAELGIVVQALEHVDPPIDLCQIIVASNFEAKINELEKIDIYKAVRGFDSRTIEVVARIVRLNDGFGIVLSPGLYTASNDIQTRLFYILHELSHIIHKSIFPDISRKLPHEDLYLSTIYHLYDEYSSDRFALDIVSKVFLTRSACWDAFASLSTTKLPEFINDSRYYDFIRAEIEAFRYHANVDLFLEKTRGHYADLAIAISHFFAWIDHYLDQSHSSNLLMSPFVNERTFALMDYFRVKYEQKQVDLFDGMDLITAFMMNFGVKFENNDQGLYCHVIDI